MGKPIATFVGNHQQSPSKYYDAGLVVVLMVLWAVVAVVAALRLVS
jgi:hypothetical protein